ncbi:helix-turn-helix transcriptional regulator [Sphingobacterium spiritivorum]|uniref:helix-turn-helix transcriptional regulator n=1 Tax=Sphingobacterium spiritivorum TaxID=258 RepID=UPI0019199184|nr:helix-turn-helix transcriptional regulator [Sphingobacterium spiritivorum]QQT24256.1 helix-turn-helix transcriptional regulator [Sphingobacterium spiritivorum]
MKIKKYIIIEGSPVLFPLEFMHSDMVHNGAKIESAGFFIIVQDSKAQQLKVKCMGESTSLSIKSHPEKDEIIIAQYLGLDTGKQDDKIVSEVNVYLNSEKDCLHDFAQAMSKVYKDTILPKNNSIHLPSSIGEGTISMSQLSTGLGLFKANVRFKNPVKFIRNSIHSNTHLFIHFNLSESSFIIKKDNGQQTDVGVDWEEAVFYSSSGKSAELELPEGKWSKWVTIIIHRSWLINKQLNYSTDIGQDLIQDFLKNKAMQGMLNLTMEEMSLAFALLQEKDNQTDTRLQTKGKVLQLLSHFITRHLQEDTPSQYADFSDVSRIMCVIGKLEKNLNSSWPTINLIAHKCLMSRTKFITLFKNIYGKSYHTMMMEIRMQKAAEFLQTGEPISEVGQKVGFSNLSHFAKTFKQIFHIEPSRYRQTISH